MARRRIRKKGLGQQLLDTMDEVITLMEQTKDPDRLRELARLRRILSRQAGRLIEANLDASGLEYRVAVAGLQNASNGIRKAVKGLESIKNAIAATTRALDLVAELAI